MLDIIRYRANLNALFLKKLNKNNKFMFDNIVANNKSKNL